MLRKFLKRFEKLEHSPNDSLYRQDMRISKRFERLEIGERKIEVVITDRIAEVETAPAHVAYSIVCPYCGKENISDAKMCISCQNSLQTLLADNFQKAARSLKKCACGAINQGDRRNCWVCGRDFSLVGDKNIAIDSENEITLTIDGKMHKSSDKNLPFEVVMLMERIRKHGYSKELIDDWIKNRRAEEEIRSQSLRERIEEIRSQLTRRQIQVILSVIVMVVYMLFRFFLKR